MDNSEDQGTGSTGSQENTGDGKATAPKSKPATTPKVKASTAPVEETKPAKPQPGRLCKEPVRYGRKTYGVGDKLPANVPAEIIARLEELGHV